MEHLVVMWRRLRHVLGEIFIHTRLRYGIVLSLGNILQRAFVYVICILYRNTSWLYIVVGRWTKLLLLRIRTTNAYRYHIASRNEILHYRFGKYYVYGKSFAIIRELQTNVNRYIFNCWNLFTYIHSLWIQCPWLLHTISYAHTHITLPHSMPEECHWASFPDYLEKYGDLWVSCQIRKIASCACEGNAGNVFPATKVWRSRHASRDACDARAVMHAGIAN